MANIIIICTGSVASCKLPEIITKLIEHFQEKNLVVKIKVAATDKARHFFAPKDLPDGVVLYVDEDEWKFWKKRGDDVLHIEIAKWADILLLAPLDCNSLGKIACGLCDNLPLCIIRAWDMKKPLIFCPAMNTKMLDHPITDIHLKTLNSWGYIEVPVIEKRLMCGDSGLGAMAEVSTIVNAVSNVAEKIGLLTSGKTTSSPIAEADSNTGDKTSD